MKKAHSNSFKFSPIAAAIAIAMTSQFAADRALAGSGFGKGVDISNTPVALPTYYANSPVGPVPVLTNGAQTINPITGLPVMANTGKALRKFVNKLAPVPGLTPASMGTANDLGQYIPLAVPEKWVDLNGTLTADDYYEMAVVEYAEKMHSDLPKATRLRGYVQLSTAKNPGKRIALKYPDGSPILDAGGVQVLARDNPHHLGPIIRATKGVAVRLKFTNYLPTGAGGNLFVPVDPSLTGAGVGPDGVTPYSQNRAGVHLVGGQAPWISAGMPHQWVAPAGEAAAYTAGLGKGVSAQNVPDMANPGNGSSTYYFPNDMSARFLFYQDRTSGLTRLNTYAGMDAGYLVTDPAEQGLITSGAIPTDQIPLIIEDKSFVPENIAQQDAKWNVDAGGVASTQWGQPGDLWFPHVYEPNQDTNSIDGANPVGRWDFGPLFWPIFPAKYALPSGRVGDASYTPEAFLDTPLINGTAYPTLTVDPKAYRFRILNASTDRYINLSLFKADTTVAPQLDQNGNPIVDAAGNPLVFANTEVKMVPAVADVNGNPPGWDPVAGVQLPLPKYPNYQTNNLVESSGPARAWPVDSRAGGTPDPTMAGPDFIAIGNDGGFLPNPVDIPAQPVTFEANRRSVTVGAIYGYGMLLGPAERSDAIVDFSKYAGQTLILYNDAPAPNPWHDERNDYYTGGPDMTGSGGNYSTKPGYGPNTRTMMQIKVNAVAPTAFNDAALVAALPAAYGASQAMPIVPQVAYNNAFGTNNPDFFAHVATGSAAQPTFDVTTSPVNGVITLAQPQLIFSGGQALANGQVIPNAIQGSGTGYDPLNPPLVVFNNTVNGVNCLPGAGASASATAVVDAATRQITQITNFNAGSGYVCAPLITFVTLPVVSSQVTVTNGGAGYTAPTATIASANGAGTGASIGSVTMSGGVVTGVTLSNLGSGYTAAPIISITDSLGGTGTGAKAITTLSTPTGIGAQATVGGSHTVSYPVLTKAEQELFDASGRYNATGGIELPLTNAVIQTTVPLNYIDTATEIIGDNEVQIWKIVDNGFWANTIHWDFVEVQVINRVGWDGTVKPPSSSDLGWKDTVKLNQLEDLVIAMRAKRPKVPFGLPKSKRMLDPSKPANDAGSGLGFTVAAGLPSPIDTQNVERDFDNEFTWGSALLSHSENDFTRPIVYSPTVIKPAAPLNLTDPLGNGTLTWTDTTPAGAAATLANPQNEIGFKILQATIDPVTGNLGAYTPVSVAGVPVTVPANVTRWTTPALAAGVSYAVVAFNAAGDSDPSAQFTETLPIAPTTFTAGPVAFNAVTLNFSGGSTSNQLQVWRQVVNTVPATAGFVAAAPAVIATLPGTATSFVDNAANAALYKYTPAASALMNYAYQIKAVNALAPVAVAGTASVSAVVSVNTPMESVAAPGIPTATVNTAGTLATLTWLDNANNETDYWVEVSADGGASFTKYTPVPPLTRTAAQRASTLRTVTTTVPTTPGSVYVFRVTAVNVTGTATSTSAAVTSLPLDLTAGAVPVAPATLTATATRVSWPAATGLSVNATATYVLEQSVNGGAFVAVTGSPFTAPRANVTTALGNNYSYRVQALATRYGLTTAASGWTTTSFNTAPAASTAPLAAAGPRGTKQIKVTWTNASSNLTGFTVQRRVGLVWTTIVPTVANVGTTYSFTDTVPAAGIYAYRVTAVSAGGSNGPTGASNAVIAP